MSILKKIGIVFFILFLMLIITFLIWIKENKKIQISEEQQKLEQLAQEIDKNYKTPLQEKYGEHIEEYNTANEVIYTFFDYVNKKDFETAYYMIEEEYKKEYGLTFEKFKALYDFQKEKEFVADDFIMRGNKYILKTKVYDFIAPDQPNDNTNFMRKEFTIFEKGKIYKLADVGIKSRKELNIKENKKILEINILKEILQTNGCTYKIKLKNISPNEVHILNDGYGIYAIKDDVEYEHTLLTGSPYDYELQSGNEKEYMVFFPNVNKAKSIGFKLESGENIKVKIY